MFYHGQGIIFIFQKGEHSILAINVIIAIGIPPALARTLLAVNIPSSLTLDSWYCLSYPIRIICKNSCAICNCVASPKSFRAGSELLPPPPSRIARMRESIFQQMSLLGRHTACNNLINGCSFCCHQICWFHFCAPFFIAENQIATPSSIIIPYHHCSHFYP